MNRFPASLAVIALLSLRVAPAGANPKPLPFSYGYPTQPEGALELEQYVDAVPVRVPRELPDGTLEAVTSIRFDLQTELEYGLTDKVELGFYFVFRQGASADTPLLRFMGTKERVRYRFAERDRWPLDLALYLEVAEFHDEIEVEEKVLLSKQLGPVGIATNLWVEQEFYFQSDRTEFAYNPTFGLTGELHPRVVVGAEYWARGRFGGSDGPRHYAGPTLLLQRDGPWIALGAYFRLDRLGERIPPLDPYGPVWVRVLLGLEL